MKIKYYSIWKQDEGRWTNAFYGGIQQNVHQPFLFTLEEAKEWHQDFLVHSIYVIKEIGEYEEEEVLAKRAPIDSIIQHRIETRAKSEDQRRRQAHADRYL